MMPNITNNPQQILYSFNLVPRTIADITIVGSGADSIIAVASPIGIKTAETYIPSEFRAPKSPCIIRIARMVCIFLSASTALIHNDIFSSLSEFVRL